MVSAPNIRARYAGFFLAMLLINLIDSAVVRSTTDPGRRQMMAASAAVDVVLVVSFLYYWMLVRPGIRARGSVILIALAGILHATYFYPNGLGAREIIGGICEASLIGFVAVQVRRTSSWGENIDPIQAIGTALERILPTPAAKLLTCELGVLYYALFSWRAKPHVIRGAQVFTIYRKGGQADLLGALPIVCLVELVPMHLLLNHWSSTMAWIGTGVSVYGMIWLIGLARAFRLRPVLVGDDYLYLRYGLLFQLQIRKEMIAEVRRAEARDRGWAVPRTSTPRVCIELKQSVDATGLFGIRRRVNRIAVNPDDEAGFESAIQKLVG